MAAVDTSWSTNRTPDDFYCWLSSLNPPTPPVTRFKAALREDFIFKVMGRHFGAMAEVSGLRLQMEQQLSDYTSRLTAALTD